MEFMTPWTYKLVVLILIDHFMYPSNIKNGGGNVFFTTFPYVRVSLRIQLQRKSLHGETVTFEEITEIYIYMA